MTEAELRRSSRVSVSIPIEIAGQDARGLRFAEQARTLDVSWHGAKLLSRFPMSPGAEIALAPPDGRNPRAARVVRVGLSASVAGAWEVAAELAKPGNVWKIPSPPADWLETRRPQRGTPQEHTVRRATPADTPAKPRALIVEDDANMGAFVEEVLQRRGWSTSLLTDPALAAAVLAAAEFDLVISDFQMPGLTGLDILRHLRQARPDLAARFILMTGSPPGDPDSRELLKSVPVLLKPFGVRALVDIVREVLIRPS